MPLSDSIADVRVAAKPALEFAHVSCIFTGRGQRAEHYTAWHTSHNQAEAASRSKPASKP